jgi:hypothetical protein
VNCQLVVAIAQRLQDEHEQVGLSLAERGQAVGGMAGVLIMPGHKAAALKAAQDSADLPLGYVAAGLLDDCPHHLTEVQWSSVCGSDAVGEADEDGRVAAVLEELVKFPEIV